MALKLPTPPTPPTPPTIDRGEATDSTPKIDAHQFFQIPFQRKSEPVAQEEISIPTAAETSITPEKKAPAAAETSITPEKKIPATAETSTIPEKKVPAAETSTVPEKKVPAAAETSITPEKKVPAAAETPIIPEKKVPAAAETSIIPEKKAPTPEDLAREAVANGAGTLTKRTVTNPEESETPSRAPIPANSNFAENRKDGKAILREFQNEDFQTARETPSNFSIDRQESHGGIFWIVTLILVSILSVVFVKKFMLRKKPAPKKSAPRDDSAKRLSQISAPKNDEGKGKHFEVRI